MKLSVLDLQNLRASDRRLHDDTLQNDRLRFSDTEIRRVKKLFQDAADSAMKNKQELMRFL